MTKNTFTKLLWLVFFVVTAAIGFNRISLLVSGELELGRVVDCGSKWVKVKEGSSNRYKDQVQYYPQAITESNKKAAGGISVLSKNLCSQMVGQEVQVLTNGEDSRIYSFIQFWGITAFALGLLLTVIFSMYNPWLVRGFFLIWVLSFAWFGGNELGVLQGYFPQLMTGTNTSQSQAALDRCVFTQMHKKGLVSRKDVTYLICQDQKITDLSSIQDLTNLEELYLQGNLLTDLSGLAPFTNLKRLSVAGIKTLTSTQGVGSLTQLIEFQANKNSIKNLSGMEQLVNLQIIGLMMNEVTDITALSSLSKLTDVTLSYNQISDLTPMANKPQLQKFTIWNNPINDLSPLFENKQMTNVGVGGNVSCPQYAQLKKLLSEEAKVHLPKSCE